MDDFIDECVLDEDGIYGALCDDIGIVAEAIEEIEDAEFDLASVCDDEDDIILNLMGIDLTSIDTDFESVN